MKRKLKNFLSAEEAIKKGNDGKNQDIKQRFVGQHVFANVGTLVEYVLNQSHESSDNAFSYDDIENFYSYPEWSDTVVGESLYFGGGNESDKETFKEEYERLKEESARMCESEEISEETHEQNLVQIEDKEKDFDSLEMTAQDIYEWWAVSQWLYEKLRDLGYPVLDAGSCYVWGRCTTGQAILLDYAITKICAEMGILEGQENSWAN